MASFLNNAYGQSVQSDKELSYEILQRKHGQKDVNNALAFRVKDKGWILRKTPFKTVTADETLDFPEISERDLTIFFTASYQLKFKVQSRHIYRESYRCFIRYKPNSFGVSGLTHYACECANDRRTVGCCSHIAAICTTSLILGICRKFFNQL